MSRAYKWAQLSKRQQDEARAVRQQMWDQGMSATVSQIAKRYDDAMAFRRGELSLAEFARLVDAVETRPVSPGADAVSARRELADWAANDGRRDDLVRAALSAGIAKTEIHELTGLARTTIDRIAPESPGPGQGGQRAP